MKNIIKENIRFLVNSNIWIALATACLYELSLIQVGVGLLLNSTVVFLFFSTLFIYNVFRILCYKVECKQWYVKNYTYTKVISVLAFIASLISFYFLDKTHLILIIIAGILTALYVGPISIGNSSKFNLRKFWFLKSVIVSIVWILLTVVLPLLENEFSGLNLIFYSLEKFFFILGITIPYDIKDLLEDESSGVKTVAMKFGINKTKWISNGFLLMGLILALFINRDYSIAIVFVYLVAMYLNFSLDEHKDELWYTFFVDGTIILYFLSIYFVSILSFF